MSTVRFFACAALSAALLSAAPQAAVEGRDYEPINPPLPVYAAAGKIEVIEFFNFSCPHCFSLLGPFAQWKHARDTADIEFRRQPVIFRRANGLYAKLFYALEAAGLGEEYYRRVFEAIHQEGKLLNSESQILDWFAEQGLEREKMTAIFNSFALRTKVEQAIRGQESYGVNSTPQIIVGGKYRLTPSLSRGYDRMMDTLTELVEMERAEQ